MQYAQIAKFVLTLGYQVYKLMKKKKEEHGLLECSAHECALEILSKK